MAKLTSSLCFVSFLLSVFALTSTGMSQQKLWCVANNGASDAQLQGFLDFCCSRLSCGEINPGGTCFAPDTVRDHASYALDLYYRIYNICSPDIGCLTPINPSHDNCYFV